VFTFTEADVFADTASDLNYYPIKEGIELLLVNGSTDPVCANVPPFAEESDAPIFGKLPNGEWIQWTPTIQLEDNGPSINDVNKTAGVLSDGGGQTFIDTGEKVKCSNVPRSFINEDTCFLSSSSKACSASQPIGETLISMNTSNVIQFYHLADKYVYAVQGLDMEEIGEHACVKSDSRWTFDLNTTCSSPTPLLQNTTMALVDAIQISKDTNEYIKDVTRTLACNQSLDETVDKIDIEIQIGSDCYYHVHPDHHNVYDFSGWVTKHPGGEERIQQWAEGWQCTTAKCMSGHPGWYLTFPRSGRTKTGNVREYMCLSITSITAFSLHHLT
jgi:hypothetical protein